LCWHWADKRNLNKPLTWGSELKYQKSCRTGNKNSIEDAGIMARDDGTRSTR
jgi:hypothetical protein